MTDRCWCVVLLGLAVCGASRPAAAEERPPVPANEARDLHGLVPSRLQESLAGYLPVAKRRNSPEWLREQSQDEVEPAPVSDDGLQLVVQQDRRDGTDLLTLRHPLRDFGSVRTYAGAGLNQVVYFADADSGPTTLSRHNRHRSTGAAAELGAEWRTGERFSLGADLRWVDIDGDASLLRSGDGLVGADPVSVGVSVGWRFR